MDNEQTTVGNVEETFTVKGKGYSQQFTDKTKAQAQYDLLQKRQIQQKQAGKIQLYVNSSNGEESRLVEEINIGTSFFNKD